MSILGVILFLLIWFLLPWVIGYLFSKVDGNPVFQWISGQMLLWAGFLGIGVAIILTDPEMGFGKVVICYALYAAALTIVSMEMLIRRRKGASHKMDDTLSQTNAAANVSEVENNCSSNSRSTISVKTKLLWVVVLLLLLLQLVTAASLAYEEGDDAFYVAVSTITEASDSMYWILPYTGGSTGLDVRHGLAPFPIWIAVLARWTGLHPAVLAQVMLPIGLILMAYGIFYLFAKRMFGGDRDKQGWFLLFAELLVLFGGQSLYTVENFLLVRTAQGKAVLAAVVLPFLLYLLYCLLLRLKQQEKAGKAYWILVFSAVMTGCLCSTQGALLCAMLLGCGGLCAAIAYKKWKVLLPTTIGCVIPVAMAILYFVLG